MTIKTPVALLLAKRLESRYDLHYTERARIALELRRLVAENRRLSELVNHSVVHSTRPVRLERTEVRNG